MTAFHGELPRGGEGRLVTYLIGPGFGESQIVAIVLKADGEKELYAGAEAGFFTPGEPLPRLHS